MAPLFAEAEQLFRGYFETLQANPQQAEVTVGGARYLLLRSDSFSIELQEELDKAFGAEMARQLRYRIAKAIGRRDAKHYLERLSVDDPVMRIALGPVHFAFVGWARVELLPETRAVADQDCMLLYTHGASFEADAYIANAMQTRETVCQMNAGYSAGWVSSSLGVELDATEVTCRARGDNRCGFVMGHRDMLLTHVARWRKRLMELPIE